ncbi:MAG: hypothetical protein ACRD59_08050 [Candidatus Acidiferrales bacterium]
MRVAHTRFLLALALVSSASFALSEMKYFPEYNVAIAVQINTDDFKKTQGPTHMYILEMAKIVLPEISRRAAR